MLLEYLPGRLHEIPLRHTSNNKPYLSSWLAMACFCFWSSIMFVSLAVSYIEYRSLTRYRTGVETIHDLILQNSVELLSIFAATFILVFLYILIHQIYELSHYYLAGFQFYYFLVSYLVVSYIQRDITYEVLVSVFALLPIQQGLIMTILLTFTGRAIHPDTISDSFRNIRIHFENWWRLARLGMTGILSISIGAAITITISDGSKLPISILLGNLFLSAIPGTLFVVVMVQKIYWFNNIAREKD